MISHVLNQSKHESRHHGLGYCQQFRWYSNISLSLLGAMAGTEPAIKTIYCHHYEYVVEQARIEPTTSCTMI